MSSSLFWEVIGTGLGISLGWTLRGIYDMHGYYKIKRKKKQEAD